MRSDTTEIETCRNELTDQHRTLTLIARTLNSTRSSKRAKETGVLEARLQEQLHALEVGHPFSPIGSLTRPLKPILTYDTIDIIRMIPEEPLFRTAKIITVYLIQNRATKTQ